MIFFSVSPAMKNQLVKIESEEWMALKSLYLPETPETILGLTTINNYIRWMQRDGFINNLAIYSLNGEWSDGTFVVVVSFKLFFLLDSNVVFICFYIIVKRRIRLQCFRKMQKLDSNDSFHKDHIYIRQQQKDARSIFHFRTDITSISIVWAIPKKS